MKSNRLLLLTLIIGTLTTSPSFAILLSQHSQYGHDSITLDTDTGLQWLDPFLATNALQYQHFNAYSDIKSMMGTGGYFEGFRYATEREVYSLLFGSVGIDPHASHNHNSTPENTSRIAHFLYFTDSTFGSRYPMFEGEYIFELLDAIFEVDEGDKVGGIVMSYYLESGIYGDGSVEFYEPSIELLNENYNPYGHFLVRETATSVNEPSSFLIVALGLLALLRLRRRIC